MSKTTAPDPAMHTAPLSVNEVTRQVGSPAVQSLGRALPPHYADQEAIIAAFRDAWANAHYNVDRLEDLHRAVQVKGRYLALPIDEYRSLDSFSRRNDAWIEASVELGGAAVRDALERAGMAPADIDHLFFVTTTGIATPSIDAYLVNRLNLRDDVKRSPIFGLGCAGGAAGVARAADYLRAFPDETAIVLSVEICSLTLQREDLSIPNMIASGLFGDGAAAAVLTGGARASRDERGAQSPLPRVTGSGSVFYRDTERIMGWDVIDSGLKVVLSAQVPQVVEQRIGTDVDAFLAGRGLDRSRVKHWIAHTGGPRVLRAFENALGLPHEALRHSWTSLAEVGNLSSASVLFVLRDHLDDTQPNAGDVGVLMAMGPGFSAELVLLEW
jgi:alkylresorcinol/alkylpyrone synthase